MSAESLPIVACTCGWPRPLIAITRADGELPEEALAVSYDCPQCGTVHRAGELALSHAQQSPRARRIAFAVRKAIRTGHQLSITVDPWAAGGGVYATITFDATGYQVTIEGKFRARPTRTKSGTCRVCGCTDAAACMTDHGPCSWVDRKHTLCSGCAP